MALGTSLTVALVGMEGHVVAVEADVVQGLPAFRVTGLPDTSVLEARDRVRAAAANVGAPIPPIKITVNLSPADVPKVGTGFDLAMAVALLVAIEVVPGDLVSRTVHVGELSLDGRLRRVRGVLPAVLAAHRAGLRRVVVPRGNEREAGLVPGMQVQGASSLAEVIAWYRGEAPPEDPGEPGFDAPANAEPALGTQDRPGDLADVVGQTEARQALEVAAAGGHHLLYVGPPGSGKTMLATRLSSLLPDLDDRQALEVTALHSLAGVLPPDGGLVRRPPLEQPHHGASAASLIGGGSGLPRPGAASRAHRGTLFLDEAAEFQPRVLQALRQPLEQGWLEVHRAKAVARFPARFQLVLATNPCPCGLSTGKGIDCTCTPFERRRYMGRLSGPLLDRVDLQVRVHAVSVADMLAGEPESTATVTARVARAHALQGSRLSGTPWSRNVEVPGAELRARWRLADGVTAPLERAVDRGAMSMRGFDRVLRVAWTLGDLGGLDRPGADEVGRAVALREDEVVAA